MLHLLCHVCHHELLCHRKSKRGLTHSVTWQLVCHMNNSVSHDWLDCYILPDNFLCGRCLSNHSEDNQLMPWCCLFARLRSCKLQINSLAMTSKCHRVALENEARRKMNNLTTTYVYTRIILIFWHWRCILLAEDDNQTNLHMDEESRRVHMQVLSLLGRQPTVLKLHAALQSCVTLIVLLWVPLASEMCQSTGTSGNSFHVSTRLIVGQGSTSSFVYSVSLKSLTNEEL